MHVALVMIEALVEPDRTSTNLIYFDSISPKPPLDQFPNELAPQYTVSFSFKNALITDSPVTQSICLPVTTPPSQNLEIVSASVAMSLYARAADYSSTSLRDRALWIELSDSLQGPRDRYFAQVLRNLVDPLLSSLRQTVPATDNPPLPINPEPVRVIVPGQANDRAGLGAMQALLPSDSPRHWCLPPVCGRVLTSVLRLLHVLAARRTLRRRQARPVVHRPRAI
jgi:hypothetical protein